MRPPDLAPALALVAAVLAASPALAGPPTQPTERVELNRMMGRWYEIARLPNKMQKDCQAGASEWSRAADGYKVVQTCRKASPTGVLQQWNATARVVDPKTNARIQMSFFGGVLKQEYWVLEHHPDQGWLILATPKGRGLWLMSQRPTLSGQVRAQALARVKQLGFDVKELEFPAQVRN